MWVSLSALISVGSMTRSWGKRYAMITSPTASTGTPIRYPLTLQRHAKAAAPQPPAETHDHPGKDRGTDEADRRIPCQRVVGVRPAEQARAGPEERQEERREQVGREGILAGHPHHRRPALPTAHVGHQMDHRPRPGRKGRGEQA